MDNAWKDIEITCRYGDSCICKNCKNCYEDERGVMLPSGWRPNQSFIDKAKALQSKP